MINIHHSEYVTHVTSQNGMHSEYKNYVTAWLSKMGCKKLRPCVKPSSHIAIY